MYTTPKIGGKIDEPTLKVEGITQAGLETTINLDENVERLAESDFDEVIKGLAIKSDDIKKTILESQMCIQLTGIAQSPSVSVMLGKPQEFPPKKPRKS